MNRVGLFVQSAGHRMPSHHYATEIMSVLEHRLKPRIPGEGQNLVMSMR